MGHAVASQREREEGSGSMADGLFLGGHRESAGERQFQI